MRTINLTADGRRHLERVTEWLEAGAPHRGSVDGFDLSWFIAESRIDCRIGEDAVPNQCGTICCIAGAIAQFDREDRGLPPLEPWCYDDSARGLVGLTNDEARELFCDYISVPTLSRVTAAEAAGVLRRLLTEGMLEWEPVLAAAELRGTRDER